MSEQDKKARRAPYRVETEQHARIAPGPDDDSKLAYVEHKCVGTPGLFVRVMRPDAKKRVRRLWVHRYKVNEPDGKGGHVKKDRKVSLGFVQALDASEVAMSMADAQQKVLNTRAATRSSRFEPGAGSPRLTIAACMEYYDADNNTNRPTTHKKDKEVIERYFGHFKERYLDELNFAFWLNLQNSLLNGRVQVGQKVGADGKLVPVFVGPVQPATMSGIITAAIKLYQMARVFEGLKNVKEDFNPPREVKKRLPVIYKKTREIPLEQIGLAMRAAKQLCPPWWCDMFECYLLTGLRRSLMVDMRFDQIDWVKGVYLIDPHRPGTKRRGNRLPKNAPMIHLPLSNRVMEILKARREFAPDKQGWVWYTSTAQRGIRVKTESRLSDPRSSWRYISEVLGDLHFGAQDLRRTYATFGGSCASDLMALSLLMLHSPTKVAADVNVPVITIDYMNLNKPQAKMRKVAEEISAQLKLVTGDYDGKIKLEPGILPEDLVVALDAESKADAESDDEAAKEPEEEMA